MFQPQEQSKDPPLPAPQMEEGPTPYYDYAEKPFRNFHHHNLSDTTTGSSESSPTTTISTVDDSSATEPSPDSSPESPPPATFAVGMLRPRTSDDTSPFFELQKQPPPKKGRNLKNLAVNTKRAPGRASSTQSLPLPPAESTSSIASPAFVKPPTPPKRRPSNLGLTLLTPGSGRAPSQEIKLAIPPTPAFGRPATLRHFQSSPSLPVVPSLPPQNFAIPHVSRVPTILDTIFSPVQEDQNAEQEEEQNFDVPLSKEEKPEAYPDGPICVYEPHIDLYLEPTAEQCRQYDVVMNVASEVRNPLSDNVVTTAEEPEIRIDGGGGIQFAPKRDHLSIQTKDTEVAQHESSPTTPKAFSSESVSTSNNGSTLEKEPEYIHIRWEHNSDIVPDLLRLVKLIDDKVTQGKRVLIHCQCGVSRSASLVVAYGLYKEPTLSVQEAYDAVKRRSQWIGPNMNLIMQLQEFRTSLSRGGVLANDRGLSPITPSSALSDWRGPFSANPTERNAPGSAGLSPLSAALTADSLPGPKPEPSSAPSGLAWPLKAPAPGERARAMSAVKPGSAYVNTSGRVVPVVPMLNIVEPESARSNRPEQGSLKTDQQTEELDSVTPTELTTSPRAEEFAMTPLQPSPAVDPADSFGLLSPSSTEFASSPFDRSVLLAQLGMGPVGQQDDVISSDVPRRSVSLKNKPKPQQSDDGSSSSGLRRIPRLHGKISSPNIREQQQLQSLQARIEASLPHRNASAPAMDGIDEALMSPRATEFTQNPFSLSLSIPPEAPPSEEAAAPLQSPDTDPRSPAQKGVSPITRNILDVL
ncbi:tyrosine/serine/threonine protein phosphatase [Vermiconidia calcicola]|uniref:Tyrosine/serine/threonine protein phosphatase n=1 Tax=Vermiconidia calcicola TaxID=1690605 RepID=A0ACC3NVU4_9PEZI|nr:tyrosine/serine/threonine protein phosphatase [Vermiconidia calcicola]